MTGGLVTTCTVIRADFWRLGQCRPGDTIHFKRVSWDAALQLRQRTEAYINAVKEGKQVELVDMNLSKDYEDTILDRIPATPTSDEVVFRQAGDSYLHVTYGPMTATAMTRAHIQHRVERLREMSDLIAVTAATRCRSDPPGSELTIAYHVQFDPLVTTRKSLLQRLKDLEHSAAGTNAAIPSRLFRFPILFDDPLAKAAVEEYMTTLRDSAVYLPDNVEYIAKANGLKDGCVVKKNLAGCRQLVIAISFLVGMPFMLPLDPR
jgi:urea carboxylase